MELRGGDIDTWPAPGGKRAAFVYDGVHYNPLLLSPAAWAEADEAVRQARAAAAAAKQAQGRDGAQAGGSGA